MTERTVSLVQDESSDVEISDVGILRTRNIATNDYDEFSHEPEIYKGMTGAGAGFKRYVTTEMKKVRRGTGGAESKQVKEKPFKTGYDAFDVIEPANNLHYLAKVYEISAPHYAAVNAKVANIVGLGYTLVENSKTKRNFENLSDNKEKLKKIRRKLDEHKDEVLKSLESMNEEDTFTEVLTKVWRDYEIMGNGYIEIGRRKDGTIGYFGHIPAQTLRIRRDRDGYVQVSGFEVQFFANYGAGVDENGEPQPIKNPVGNDTPNEVIHLRKYSPTSDYYGVPDIIPAMSAVAGDKFAADFNLDYFENKALPRYAIILKGAKLNPAVERKLLSFFETNLKGQNHRSIVIPLPGDTDTNKVELTFEAIEAGTQDSSFTNYKLSNQATILTAHRVPLTKIDMSEGSALAAARDADKTFKEQVCNPEQTRLQKKLRKMVEELTDAFDLEFNQMTLTDEKTQADIDQMRIKTGTEIPNEQRARRGQSAIEGGDERFDLMAAMKVAEMNDKTVRRGQDKNEAQAKAANEAKATTAGSPGANSSGNPAGTRQRDTTRAGNRTDSAGEGRNAKGDGRTTS